MRQADLIKTLIKECRTERDRVEDILQVIFDLAVEAIKRGEGFPLGNLGWLYPKPYKNRSGSGPVRAMLNFHASTSFRKEINGTEIDFPSTLLRTGPVDSKDICPRCRLRPRRRFKTCASCDNAERYKRTKAKSQALRAKS